MPTIECPKCKTEIQVQPVQDIVVEWSGNAFTDTRPMVASVTPDGALVIGVTAGKKILYLKLISFIGGAYGSFAVPSGDDTAVAGGGDAA